MCGTSSNHINCCCRGLKNFIQPRILLRIARKPMYGYELLESLESMPHPGSPDTGGMYRLLRSMEEEGLLSSSWDTGDNGPARRIYSITPKGEENLNNWIQTLQDTRDWLEQFLSDYMEYKEHKASIERG
jgi:PadR family transcriptional regulator PadR